MTERTATAERRSGIHWLVASAIFLVAMLGMWWLVEETNEEGTHDAEALPFFTLIPLGIGLFHLVRARMGSTTASPTSAPVDPAPAAPAPKELERTEVLDPFDRLFGEQLIRVDELRENGTLVVRAELPGIDPDKDTELTVQNGMLHIRAERREEEETEENGYVRHETHYGSFFRTLPLPAGVSEADVEASYKDGVLEVRVPAPAPAPPPAPITTIPVTRA